MFGHTFEKCGKRSRSEEEIVTEGIIKKTHMNNNVDSGNEGFVEVIIIRRRIKGVPMVKTGRRGRMGQL